MKKLLLSVSTAAILIGSAVPTFAATPSAAGLPESKPIVQQQESRTAHSHEVGEGDEPFAHPNLGVGAQHFDTANFRIHYTLQGASAVEPADDDKDGIPNYVELVGATLEHVHDISVNKFGWAPPPPDGHWGGNALYDVYLENLMEEGLGGYVDGGQPEALVGDNPHTPNVVEARASVSYMGLDKSYKDPEDPTLDPIKELQTTAAHEYFHSIQFGYDGQEPADWIWEASANWMMEEVYPELNGAHIDLAAAYDSPDVTPDGQETDWYAQWLFFRHISERYGHNAVKAIWETARTQDGYAAINAALQRAGTTLDEVMRNYRLALLLNNFQEGADYPTVRLEGAVTDQFQPTDGVDNLGADYLEIQRSGPVTVKLTTTELEGLVVGVRNGKAGVFPMTNNQVTVDSDAFDHLYLIVRNVKWQGPTSGNWIDYQVTVTPGGNSAAAATTVDAPNFTAPQVAERTTYDENSWGEEWGDEEWDGTEGDDTEWGDEEWNDEEWDDDDWKGEITIDPPANLIPGSLPAGYELVDAYDDGMSQNVIYVDTSAGATELDEPFISLSKWHEPIASLDELGIDAASEAGSKTVNASGLRILIEQEDGILYATFVQNGTLIDVATTLSQAETLMLIASLPKS